MRAMCVMVMVSGAGCLAYDEPVPIAPPGSEVEVQWLSELGVFEDIGRQTLAEGFWPYEPTVSLYSDGVWKRRALHVPSGETAHATADVWEVPVGSYLMKTFFVPLDGRRPEAGERRIETRFLVRVAGGYVASTYLWNDEQTDAEVSGGNVDVPLDWIDAAGVARTDHFHVPGTSQCQGCHFDRALGLRTPLMDREEGDAGQIDRLVAAGAVDGVPSERVAWPDPFDDGAPLELRARAYLATNCGHCHSDEGDEEAIANGVRWDFASTATDRLPLCKRTASVDGRDRVIVPGHPEDSELIARMWSDDPFVRMPRGPTHIPDGAGIALLEEWIAAMPEGGCR